MIRAGQAIRGAASSLLSESVPGKVDGKKRKNENEKKLAFSFSL